MIVNKIEAFGMTEELGPLTAPRRESPVFTEVARSCISGKGLS